MPSDIETTLPRTSFLVEVRVAGTTETHAVVEALFSLGSFGVQEIGTELVTYLHNSLSREAIRNAVSTVDALAHVAFLKAPPVDATTNAVANIRVNGVGDRVHYMEGDAFALLPLIAPVDIVLANILSSVLIELLPAIRDSLTPGGRAILSGILLDERMIMLDEILAEGWRAECEDVEEGWWAVLISRS